MSKLFSVHEHNIILGNVPKYWKNNNICKCSILKKDQIKYLNNNDYLFIKCEKCQNKIFSFSNDFISVKAQIDIIEKKRHYNDYEYDDQNNDNINYEDLVTKNEKFYAINRDDYIYGYLIIGTIEEKKKYFREILINDCTQYSNRFSKRNSMDYLDFINKSEKDYLSSELNKVNSFYNKVNKERNNLFNQNKKLENSLETANQTLNELKIVKNELQNQVKSLKQLNDKYKKELDDLKQGIIFEGEKNDEDTKYDIVIDITSLRTLNTVGWNIKYPKGKEEYERKSKKDAIIAGILGNRNKGKSFILQKLSGFPVAKGFTVVTEGLSIKYGEEEDHCIAILDSAGKEAPLLNPRKIDDKEIENKLIKNKANQEKENDEKLKEDGKIKQEQEYEICLRDKLIAETYIQKFIMEISHILILVVGNINLNEQKLLENIKKSLKREQYLYVIHNLFELKYKEDIENYIEGQLKNLYGIKLKEINFQDNKGNYHQKYYVEEGNEKITHLIYVNEYSPIAEYYNNPTINFLKNKNKAEQRRTKFSVIDSCKEYLEKISDKFIEEKITKDKFDDKNDDIIKIKDENKIILKRVFIDEIGKATTSFDLQPIYSYYTTKKDLIINVEVPGEGADLKSRMVKGEEFYTFYFKGMKPCDESVIKDEHKIKENIRNQYAFNFILYISIKDIVIDLNDEGKLNFYEKKIKNGIFTFKYHLINSDETSEFE